MTWSTHAKGLPVLLGFLIVAACASVDPTKDVALTWDQAYVRIPGVLPLAPSHRHNLPALLPPGARYPTIIYLHGAGGLSRAARGDMDVALEAGAAVIALNSYARNRPLNPGVSLSYRCPNDECWPTFDTIFAMRTAELAYALEQLRHVPWIDQGNVFGWGQSEGGYMLAAYPGAVFKARILTGTGCHHGFNAEEPVLAVISQNDPYVRSSRTQYGSPSTCRKVSGNADNLTYVELPGEAHNGALQPEGRKAVVTFLRHHITSP